jgi:hypothetical protein
MANLVKTTSISMFIIGLFFGIIIGFIDPFIQDSLVNIISVSVAFSMIVGTIGIGYSITKTTQYTAQ